MVRFRDGPAAGVVLGVRRAPLYLRVVFAEWNGQWDALDRLEDRPDFREAVWVYRRVGPSQQVHVCGKKAGKRWGGVLAIAEYTLHADQPGDRVTRDRTRWREWCLGEVAKG